MAKNKSSFEGQELAPMEPWRPEYAPQAITSRRHPASTIVAFVLAAGFGLSIGGYALLACAISWLVCGRKGLYDSQ